MGRYTTAERLPLLYVDDGAASGPAGVASWSVRAGAGEGWIGEEVLHAQAGGQAGGCREQRLERITQQCSKLIIRADAHAYAWYLFVVE